MPESSATSFFGVQNLNAYQSWLTPGSGGDLSRGLISSVGNARLKKRGIAMPARITAFVLRFPQRKSREIAADNQMNAAPLQTPNITNSNPRS